MTEKWYAIYTKPRWEKKVSETLNLMKLESYCPLNKVHRQWSDRKKVVMEPLFTSYVFVRVTEKQHAEIKKVNGVLSLVTWLGKPAVIKDHEIETIKQFLSAHSNVKLEKAQVRISDSVQITAGALTGKEGTVVTVKNSSAIVALPTLGYVMFAELEKTNLKKTAVA